MAFLKTANLTLAFLLELCMLAALGYWGFSSGSGWITRIGLGLGAPVLCAVVWGTFLSPRAAVHVPEPIHVLLEVVVFGAAVAALAAAGLLGLAWAFGIITVLNKLFLYIWR